MLDAVTREDGVLFFATTNTLDGIDSALFQAGRIDKTIDFGYISKDQANTTFKRFFPSSTTSPEPTGYYEGYLDDAKYAPPFELAEQFSSQIPDNEFTISDIRFYLMSHQSSPEAAISGVLQWIDAKREERAKRIEAEEQASEQARRVRITGDIGQGDQWTPFQVPFVPLNIGSSPMSSTMDLPGCAPIAYEFPPSHETEEHS